MKNGKIKGVVLITKDQKKQIQDICKNDGIRVSKWYSDAIVEKIEKDLKNKE